MSSASEQDVLSLMLQSTLAVDALFFGLLALLAALLNETISDINRNKQKLASLRADYEAEIQAKDILDTRRQRALEALRDLQAAIARESSRSRLVTAALLIVAVMIIVATVVTVYSFTLLHRTGVGLFLQMAFYALMLAPLVGAVVIVVIVRRISHSED